MKYTILLFSLVLLPVCSFAFQENKIPNGVRYKPAADVVNEKAKTKIEKLLSSEISDGEIDNFFYTGVICAPGVWQEIKDIAGEKQLSGTKMSNDRPVRNAKGETFASIIEEGRYFRTKEQLRLFWRIFLQKCVAGNNFTVRKATTAEIQYFWERIPFDIEEPLFVIDLKQKRYILEFTPNNGDARVLWIDSVEN